jgi:hypothetical protein
MLCLSSSVWVCVGGLVCVVPVSALASLARQSDWVGFVYGFHSEFHRGGIFFLVVL